MEIVNYTTDDFVMTVESHRIEDLFARASRKINDINKSTQYLISGTKGILKIWRQGQEKETIVEPGVNSYPVFFENSDYIFDVEFRNAAIQNTRVYSRLNEITEKFTSKQRGGIHTLTGTLNYGNDIGKYDFVVRYEKDHIKKEFCFSFEVFPTKLDYKNDYRIIVADIEKEYSNLVLDFLKKTYSSFKSNPSKGNDLIWWSIFGGIYKELLQAARLILNKPHSRLVSFEVYSKRDRLKKLTPQLEEQLVLYKEIPHKLYCTSNKQLTLDTTENRFFKYVMRDVYNKFSRIKSFIESNRQYVISAEFGDELKQIEKELRSINYHPFFKNISEYKGVAQESLVLQKKSGYSSIYRNWILLKRGLNLFDGIQKIELKNIADLYQIWCFLKMKGMIQSILGKSPAEVDLAQVQVDNFLFTLKKGKASKVVFNNEAGDKIELYHDYTYSNSVAFQNLSYTVDQRPDIVLKISKNDLKDNYVFTYLYDAKYRLKSDEKEDEPDFPPNDAINQMHRYRDAIYYLDKETPVKGKEVIGGYILFPGSGTTKDIKSKSFYTSIKDVNIGAFPLVPNDANESQKLLRDHLKKIIDAGSENIFQEVTPQKGMNYEDTNAYVLAGFISGENQRKYFESGTAKIYHMPVYSKNTGKINTIRNLEKLKYFSPIINGIQEFYEIESVIIQSRKDIFERHHPFGLYSDLGESYYVFKLSNRKILLQKIEMAPGGNRIFRYARLAELRSAKSISFFNRVKQEE